LSIGWNWLTGVLHQGWQLFDTISLYGGTDLHPAVASQKQAQKHLQREFTVNSFSFVT